MELKYIEIIAIVLVSVIALGCVESQSSAPTSIESPKTTVISTPISTPAPVKTSTIITASPSQMLPTINDMPDGSKKAGSEIANETYALRQFAIIDGITVKALRYEVNKFSSINDAMNYCNIIKNKYSDNKLNSVNLGDEGFGFLEVNTRARVVFRKANVVVKVELTGTYYSATLEDAITFAEMVNTPTSTLKLVADTKTLTKGETWDMGSGYTLKVMTIDQNASPKQVWLELSKDGSVLDDFVSSEGKTYTYNNIFTTKIESISDTEIVLRDTYVVS